MPTTEEEREEHGEDGSGLTNLARKLVDAVRRRKASCRAMARMGCLVWGYLRMRRGLWTRMASPACACDLVGAVRQRKGVVARGVLSPLPDLRSHALTCFTSSMHQTSG